MESPFHQSLQIDRGIALRMRGNHGAIGWVVRIVHIARCFGSPDIDEIGQDLTGCDMKLPSAIKRKDHKPPCVRS